MSCDGRMSCCRCAAAGESVLFGGSDVDIDVARCERELIGARLSSRQPISSWGDAGEG